MNSVSRVSTVQPSVRPVAMRAPGGPATSEMPAPKGWWLLAAMAVVAMGWLTLWHREAYTGDEGFYGVTALNMLAKADYWLRPSYFPLGDFLADKDAFAHPPLNSFFYAISLWFARGSLVGPELLGVLNFGLLLWLAHRVLRRLDAMTAMCGVALVAASPALIRYFSMLEAEPLMISFGLASLVAAMRAGVKAGERHWQFWSGLGLGLAFALKLWLCAPLALAVAAALGVRVFELRPAAGEIVAAAARFAVGLVLPSAMHLAAVAWVHPEDLTYWLRNIYFGIFTHAGISGSKMAGAAVKADWLHPIWYYAPSLYRDYFYLVPPLLLGLRDGWRARARIWRLAVPLLACIAGVVPLSLMKVKEPLYVLTCAVYLHLFAALCLSEFVRSVAVEGRLVSRRWEMGLMLGLLLAMPAALALQVQPGVVTVPLVVAHSAVMGAGLLMAVLAGRRSDWRPVSWILGVGAAGLALSTIYVGVTRPARDAAIVRLVRPYVTQTDPGVPVMFASNFKGYQYPTFRTGRYFKDMDPAIAPEAWLAEPRYRAVRVFIMDPEDQARPTNARWIEWLSSHRRELTAELDAKLGQRSGFRVWVDDRPRG